jgi:2-haloacid dehalogenase
MELYRALDAFPEVPVVLNRLQAAGLKTVIPSNGSPDTLDAAVKKAGGFLDAVLSVEVVGVYKPYPKAYQLAVDRLVIPVSAISFQSYAASAFGMLVVWCNRYGQRPERLPGRPDREIASLDELAAIVGAQL